MFSYYKILNSLEFTSDIIFNKKIKGDTAQGSCGLLIFKSENIDENKDDEIVSCRELIIDFKTNIIFYKYGNSGSNCTLSRQEYIIGDSLVKTCSHFPNFMRPILYIKNHLIRTDSYDDPFNLETIKDKNYISCVDIVLFEYIQSSITLWKILKNKDLSDEFKNSLLMQIFLAIIAAQQNVKFVHNDLHGNNILVIKCDKNLKILYRIKINGKEKIFLIPTYGYIPIIIDYGFSYTSECENMSLECADLDNYGLITYQFDSISDFIRLLVVISSVKYNEQISDKIFNLFKDLPISMEKSWETNIVKYHSISDIEDIFIKCYGYKNYKKNKKYCDQFLRLLLRNIILPIKYNQKYEDVNPEDAMTDFLFYWKDISKWLKYNFEKIFMLREFIDSIRKHGYDYNVIDDLLKKNIFHITGKNYPIKYDIKSMIIKFKACIGSLQNILYKNITELDKKRHERLYSVLKSGEHMFEYILPLLYNYDDKCSINKEDIILLIDNIDVKNKLFNMPTGEYYPPEIYKKYFELG